MDLPPPALADPRTLPAGDSTSLRRPPAVPDYELLRCIGHGSYGDVWLARNVLGHLRAVKIIYRSRFADPRPFEREFEGIQRFEPISRSHPSQLAILHVGKNEAADCFYYVMELAEPVNSEVGMRNAESNSAPTSASPIQHSEIRIPNSYTPHTLRHDLEQRGRLPIPDCVQIGLSLATALAHLHEQGLVHRDIKPSNVIFVNGVAKLGDIGLVTEAGDTQSIVGTEGYLPPEGPGTPQADLYSLGKVLYEISTGLDRRQFAELPERLREWPDCNAVVEFNEIVLKACAKDPARRYQTAEQLRAELVLLQEGKSVRRARGQQRLWAQVKKVAVGLVLLALVVAGIARLARQTQRNEAASDGPPSTNQYANALVDKAFRSLRANDSTGSLEIYTNLLNAVELDPNFARAYVALFDLLVDRTGPGLPRLSQQELRRIVDKLKQLAPELASTHGYRSILAYADLDFAEAEKQALKAIAADPAADREAWYGFLLTHWGRAEEARQRLKNARAFESSGGFIYRVMGHSYYAERDFTNAIAWYRQAINWEPLQASAIGFLGEAYQAMGDYTNSFDHLAKAQILYGADPAQTQTEFDQYRRAFAEGGVRGYWEERQKQVDQRSNLNPYDRAVIQIHLGETNAALDSLYQYYEQREQRERRGAENKLGYLLFHECWDGIRGDRRFRELLDKVGYTSVMKPSKN